jgi:PAS domain S-box-containing protein
MMKSPIHNDLKTDMLDNAPVIIAFLDMDHNIVWANKAYQKTTGLSLQEMEGKKCYLSWGLAEPCSNCPVMKAINTGEPSEAELTPQNQEQWSDTQGLWLIRAMPIRNEDGDIIGAMMVAFDITDRKKAEKTLRESEEQLQTLINAMPGFICFKDGDGRWIKVNDAGIRIFQLENIDYRGRTDSELAELSNHLQGAFLTCEKSDKMAWNEKRLFTQEERISQSDGTIRDYDVTKVPVFHSDGRRKGIVVIGHDITDRKNAEDALRKSEKKYRSLTENMSDIVYSIDLNGTLTYISPQTKQYGINPETLISRNLLEIVHPEDRDSIAKEYQRVLETGKEFPSTFRVLDTEEDIHWFEDIGKIQRDKEGNVTGLAGVLRDITERKQTEKALCDSEQNFRDMTNLLPQIVFEIDTDGNLTFVNKQAFDSFGYSQEEFEKGVNLLQTLIPSDRKKTKENIQNSLRGKAVRNSEYTALRKDGSTFPIVIYSSAILKDNKPVGLRGIIVDATELKHAEEEKAQIEDQYRQAQKMESVGRLAGGVAHDFNNMLGVILGYTEILQNKISPDQPIYAALQEIHKAADRSADLTRQLLAFARRQTVSPKVLELNETVEGMLNMLLRLIGEDIDLVWLPGTDLWPIMVDPAQIDQILANLCVNGRDAIAGVGKMTIETRNVFLNKSYCNKFPGSIPGEYILLAVSDDGCGMDNDTLENLFEPFFTTKEVGQGTGLGLATVYGIVKQNNGFINVCSKPGEGTTCNLYLSRYVGEKAQMQKESQTEPVGHGNETILLVEDEPAILEMATAMLEMQGYTVLAATIPCEAILMAEKYDSEIHLLMTDVVMPEMNGRDLAKKLLSLRPDIKYLFMSGYTANVIAHRRVLDEGINFIQKPFTLQDLSTKVREVLDCE